MESIKITSFKRVSKQNDESLKHYDFLQKDSTLLNVLLYEEDQNQKSKQIEKWILKQQRQNITFLKLLDQKSILHAIRNVFNKNHKKTFFITTKCLTKQIQSIVQANKQRQLIQKLNKLSFILILDEIEGIEWKNFAIKNISLISTKADEIKEYLQNEIEKISIIRPLSQVSSINSQQQLLFQEQFNNKIIDMDLPQKLETIDSKTSQAALNQNPGPGQYNVGVSPEFSHKSGKFSKSQRNILK